MIATKIFGPMIATKIKPLLRGSDGFRHNNMSVP